MTDMKKERKGSDRGKNKWDRIGWKGIGQKLEELEMKREIGRDKVRGNALHMLVLLE